MIIALTGGLRRGVDAAAGRAMWMAYMETYTAGADTGRYHGQAAFGAFISVI
jgi:hypothetical protein